MNNLISRTFNKLFCLPVFLYCIMPPVPGSGRGHRSSPAVTPTRSAAELPLCLCSLYILSNNSLKIHQNTVWMSRSVLAWRRGHRVWNVAWRLQISFCRRSMTWCVVFSLPTMPHPCCFLQPTCFPRLLLRSLQGLRPLHVLRPLEVLRPLQMLRPQLLLR